MLREAGRQGVLPFATFWSRVGRFKTPYGPVLLKWTLSTLLVLATPASDTFAFLVDLASYPSLVCRTELSRCLGINAQSAGVWPFYSLWCLDIEAAKVRARTASTFVQSMERCSAGIRYQEPSFAHHALVCYLTVYTY